MKLGLVARSDNGGLAAQSIEFSKSFDLSATLVVNLGDKGRGRTNNFNWQNPHFVDGPSIDDIETVTQFIKSVDIIFSIETFYGTLITELANKYKKRTVRYANPELYQYEGEDHLTTPTHWQNSNFRGRDVAVIRQGITLPDHIDELKRSGPARTLLHMAAPAMLDRNGTRDFYAALANTKQSFRIKVVGDRPMRRHKTNLHQWIINDALIPNRFNHYSTDVDLLVLPRRYAGLSLPMLEAAAYGIPTITTDVAPQNAWFVREALVPTRSMQIITMVGGRVPVYAVEIMALAERLDKYALESIEELSASSIEWAKYHSWHKVKPIWMDYFQNL